MSSASTEHIDLTHSGSRVVAQEYGFHYGHDDEDGDDAGGWAERRSAWAAVRASSHQGSSNQLRFTSGDTVDSRTKHAKPSVRDANFHPTNKTDDDDCDIYENTDLLTDAKTRAPEQISRATPPADRVANQSDPRESVILQDANIFIGSHTFLPKIGNPTSGGGGQPEINEPLVRNMSTRSVESQIISRSFEFLKDHDDDDEEGDENKQEVHDHQSHGSKVNGKNYESVIPEDDVYCDSATHHPRPFNVSSKKPPSRVSVFINRQFDFLPPEDDMTSFEGLDGSEISFDDETSEDGAKRHSLRRDSSDGSVDHGEPWLYAESFRFSRYVRKDDPLTVFPDSVSGDKHASVSSGYGTAGSTGSEGKTQRVRSDSTDTSSPTSPWFDGDTASSHSRSESISTTASEREFREHFCADFGPDNDVRPSPSLSGGSCRRRLIRRKSSTSTYKRLSDKLTESVRKVEVVKDQTNGSQYGFHLLGPPPIMVSTVEQDSPAALAGIEAGDVIVTVNEVHVYDSALEEVVEVISRSNGRVVLGLSSNMNAAPEQLTEEPLCKGYLNKQGDKMFKNWKRRWFELKPDHCLYYYKSEDDRTPMGAISLINYTVIKAQEVKRDNVFKLVKYGNRTYFLQADTAEEMDRWASAISTLSPTNANDGWLEVSSHNVTLPALSIKSPDCHGFLTKLGNNKKTWRRRYCVLKDACLYYYGDVTSGTAKGVAHLHGYTVKEGSTYNKRFSFTLVPPEPVMRTFYFVGENETDFKRWTSAMEMSIGKWIKVKT